MIKHAFLSLVLIVWAGTLRADLTVVQKVEGAGPVTQMMVKIKGNKARIDSTPQMTTIIDSKTGEMINLMKDQKAAVRVSSEKMKAAAEMVTKFDDNAKKEAAPKLTPTGKKETINGYETEQYVLETPSFKSVYWIAATYPDAASILQQLQSLNSDKWSGSGKMPDYRDFPGVPLKTEISMGKNQKITSTVISLKQDALSDADFSIPADFKEMKSTELQGMMGAGAGKPEGTPKSKEP